MNLTAIEKRFEADYPGKFGRFSDGEREILMRYVAERTRKLHPTEECFKAAGYTIEPMPLWIDTAGVRWGAYKAARGVEQLWIYERIHDQHGNSYTDVSAWYWAALFGETLRPWWSVTISERQDRNLRISSR